MDAFNLTPEQLEVAERIEKVMLESMREDIHVMACMLAAKECRQLLGQTEFQVRDGVHKIGAKMVETALQERKKRGTKARA
jgi:hypothetical protein